MIQLYLNNATNLHTVRRVAPQHRDRNVTIDCCDVTSPWVVRHVRGVENARKYTVPKLSADTESV